MKAEGRFSNEQLVALSRELWTARGAVDASKRGSKTELDAALARVALASERLRLALASNEALAAEVSVPNRPKKRAPAGHFVDETPAPTFEVPQRSEPNPVSATAGGTSPVPPISPRSSGRRSPHSEKGAAP